MPTTHEIAAWRLKQITPFLDPSSTPRDRELARNTLARTGAIWPFDEHSPHRHRRIRRSTLERWIKAYGQGGLEALAPKLRADYGQIRRKDAEPWICKAIQLLYEQHGRSLTQLEAYLRIEFDGYNLSRATLHRHIIRHPAYPGIQEIRKLRRRKLRDSFEAKRPHECWQLDGKGPFPVKLINGTVVRVHVLSVLDDFSRAILAAVIAPSESTEAAIRVFRMAAERYGLADRFQFDRGSAFDSDVFRQGLALCGIHRNFVRPRHPEAQGKIEAYHRSLGRWFVAELAVQEVLDLEHLQQLLEATIATLYNRHYHTEIGGAPSERLASRPSSRRLAPRDIERAFFTEVVKRSDPKTGVVELPSGRFRVPLAYAGKSCRIQFDPVNESRAILFTKDRREIALEPFATKSLPKPRISDAERRGTGQLQKLVDRWQGKERPIAEPGFGMPEVFDALGSIVGRTLPETEREALEISDFCRRFGPFARTDFVAALERTKRALGTGRPVSAYLLDLERQVTWSRAKNEAAKKDAP